MIDEAQNAAFGLGLVIHFFNRVFTGKLLAWVDGE